MRQRKSLRRLVLDLTPLIDMITILLFGVMINSVQIAKKETTSASAAVQVASDRLEADQKALQKAAETEKFLQQTVGELKQQLAQARAQSKESESERAQAARRLVAQREELTQSMAKLLQMNESEHRAFREHMDRISRADARRLGQVFEEMRRSQDPSAVYKALRRIDEMQKLFTFVDLHLAEGDFLVVTADGRELDRLPVRSMAPTEIENLLRRALEAVNFNPLVLIMFSYEGRARDLTVERTETAINALLAQYRSSAGSARQFRYGRVGLVEPPPSERK